MAEDIKQEVVQEEKRKPGRPKAEPTTNINVDKKFLQDLMDRVEAAESKITKAGKPGIETASQRLLAKPQMGEPDMNKVQESIQVVDVASTIGGLMLKDCCPYCKKYHKGQATILDLTQSAKYACRRCGKHWEQWALKKSELTDEFYPYSEALEKGDRKRVEYQERIKMAKAGMAVGIVEGEESD